MTNPSDQITPGDKILASISYLGLLVLVPLILDSKSPFVRFHANQGIVLLFSFMGLPVVSILVCKILGGMLWDWLIVGLFVLFFMVIGIVNAASGQLRGLPLIGRITLRE